MRLLTQDLIDKSREMAQSMLYSLSHTGSIRRPHPHVGYLVVLDGTEVFNPLGFDSAVLFEQTLNRDLWPAGKQYDVIARGKALVAWRERMDTLSVVRLEPWRLQNGDCRYAGAVWRSGLVVAFSGLEAVNDHILAAMLAEYILGQMLLDSDQQLAEFEGAFLGR